MKSKLSGLEPFDTNHLIAIFLSLCIILLVPIFGKIVNGLSFEKCLYSTAGEAIRAVVLSASSLSKIQRPDLTRQYITLHHDTPQYRTRQTIQCSLDIS